MWGLDCSQIAVEHIPADVATKDDYAYTLELNQCFLCFTVIVNCGPKARECH